MSQTTQLLDKYRAQLVLPQSQFLSAAERVWIAIYDPIEERRIRANLHEFALATQQQGLEWSHFDLTPRFINPAMRTSSSINITSIYL